MLNKHDLRDYEQLPFDPVNKPKHYMLFPEKNIEIRDVIQKLVNKIPPSIQLYGGMFTSDYVQMMQYGMRFMEKNGLEDLKKMRWYLDKLIESYEQDKVNLGNPRGGAINSLHSTSKQSCESGEYNHRTATSQVLG